jgi:hypothetical protein
MAIYVANPQHEQRLRRAQQPQQPAAAWQPLGGNRGAGQRGERFDPHGASVLSVAAFAEGYPPE